MTAQPLESPVKDGFWKTHRREYQRLFPHVKTGDPVGDFFINYAQVMLAPMGLAIMLGLQYIRYKLSSVFS